jgi:hypothetical protein
VRKGLQNKGKTTKVGGEEHTKLVIVLQELLLLYRSADFDEYPRFSHEHSEIFKKESIQKNRCCIPVHKPVFSPAGTRYPHNNVAD